MRRAPRTLERVLLIFAEQQQFDFDLSSASSLPEHYLVDQHRDNIAARLGDHVSLYKKRSKLGFGA